MWSRGGPRKLVFEDYLWRGTTSLAFQHEAVFNDQVEMLKALNEYSVIIAHLYSRIGEQKKLFILLIYTIGLEKWVDMKSSGSGQIESSPSENYPDVKASCLDPRSEPCHKGIGGLTGIL